MKNSNWTKQEIKLLFKNVAASANIYAAFIAHAKAFKRKPNSVRNFYYITLKNKALLNSLKILASHNPRNPKRFSLKEEEELVKQILMQTSSGKSVRAVCLNLSQNNVAKMLRLQNKFRALSSAKPELIAKAKQDLGLTNNKTNIIKLNNFKQPPLQTKPKLTNSDITNLFMGLVRLAKKTNPETPEIKTNAPTTELDRLKLEVLILKKQLEQARKNSK